MIDFVRQNMAPLMFGGLVVFMLIGYPAAFSLAAVGLFFGFIGIELGLIRPDFLGNLTYQLYGIISNDLLLAIRDKFTSLFATSARMCLPSYDFDRAFDNVIRTFENEENMKKSVRTTTGKPRAFVKKEKSETSDKAASIGKKKPKKVSRKTRADGEDEEEEEGGRGCRGSRR